MFSRFNITLIDSWSLCNPGVHFGLTFSGDCFIGERRKLDIEYFSKLLDKILEVQKNRKKLKSLTEKNSTKKNKNKAKGKCLSIL